MAELAAENLEDRRAQMTILRGNSASNRFANTIAVQVETELNTDGCSAVLAFGGWSGNAELADGVATFTFTKEQTERFEYGDYYATISLTDGTNFVTVADGIIVSVTDSPVEVQLPNEVTVTPAGLLKGVRWDETDTIASLREFLAKVGVALGATVQRRTY